MCAGFLYQSWGVADGKRGGRSQLAEYVHRIPVLRQTCELRSVLLFDGSPWQQSSLGAWGRSSSIGQRSHESGRAGHVHDSSEVHV